MTQQQEAHPVREALKARKRKIHEVDVGTILGLEDLKDWAGQPLAKVAVRVATKNEQDAAVEQATAYSEKTARRAASDPDVLTDAKSAAIVAACFRDLKRPDQMPIWPAAEEVCRLLTADQIGALLDVYNRVRRAESPYQNDIGDDDLDKLVDACVSAASFVRPTEFLARIERTQLETMFVMLGLRVHELRARLGESTRDASIE